MNLLIAGSGPMAEALRTECTRQGLFHKSVPLVSGDVSPEVGVYLGSDKNFHSFLSLCAEEGIPVLQCASGIKLPEVLPTAVIEMPNAAFPLLLFLKYITMLSLCTSEDRSTWALEESHQRSKTTPSGTANFIAEKLKIPRESILSQRNQAQVHSYHHLTGVADGIEMEFSFKVNGREPYARGMIILARVLRNRQPRLEPGLYNAWKFFSIR